MPTERTRPVHEIRLGRIKASIWQREFEDRTFFSTTIVRLYKNGTAWRDSASFDRDDLPLVAKVADHAHSWIFERMQERKDSDNTEPSDVEKEEF
jgi:hypothetical protein